MFYLSRGISIKKAHYNVDLMGEFTAVIISINRLSQGGKLYQISHSPLD
jgi:hypothetical protein